MAKTENPNKFTSLYRKYRPSRFEEVLGQEHIVSVLMDSIKKEQITHSYLFVGSRGTGKTSVARIFAKELGVSPNDLYEIDAASNRSIEDIKELRNGVRSLPFDSKYKIYIIDEAHMLSKDAWGALLKTLEEPPSHAIFIMATTEFHKVPETIISRCQVFTFKKASEEILKKMLLQIALKEKIELDPAGAEIVALLADGSFRDGLSILDKVLTFYRDNKKKKIDRVDIERITGAPKNILVNDYLESIIKGDIDQGLSAVAKAVNENLDLKLFFKLVLLKFRLAILLKYAPKFAENYEESVSPTDLAFLNQLIKEDQKAHLRSNTLVILLEAYADMDNVFISSLPLELALIKILGKEAEKDK